METPMHATEFTTKLSGTKVLEIPQDIVDQLPKSGMARIIILTEDDIDDAQWRHGAYQQFLRDDSSEDSVYDSSK
jgi:hypothetical protein